MTLLKHAVGAAALMMAATSAQAQVVTFGPGNSAQFVGPVTENGITYSVASGALFANFAGNPDGDLEGYAAFGGGVASFVSSSATPFAFANLDYAAFGPLDADQTLVVQGYLGGSLVGTDTFTLGNTDGLALSYTNWTTFNASNLAGQTLDELRVSLNGSVSPVSYQAIDNVTFGVPGAVPEPSTWAMMLLGFGGIAFAMRRKRTPVLARA